MKTVNEKFKQYLERRYPERSTTKHYISDLRIFSRFVKAVSPKEIKPKVIDEFVQDQSQQGKKGKTINRRLSSLSSFFDFLINEAEDDSWTNPVRWKRHAVKLGRHLPRDVSDETVRRLFGVMDDVRDRAMFTLMVSAGLRASELTNLRLADCDLQGQRLRVQAGKGDRDRVLPMTPQLVTVLAQYQAVRETAPTDHWLIYKGAPLKRHVVPYRLRLFGLKAQIEPLSPHRLRHTLATFLINQEMPIVSLQKFLGHQDINKTLIYARVYDETVRRQFVTAMAQIESIPVADWPIQIEQLNAPVPS